MACAEHRAIARGAAPCPRRHTRRVSAATNVPRGAVESLGAQNLEHPLGRDVRIADEQLGDPIPEHVGLPGSRRLRCRLGQRGMLRAALGRMRREHCLDRATADADGAGDRALRHPVRRERHDLVHELVARAPGRGHAACSWPSTVATVRASGEHRRERAESIEHELGRSRRVTDVPPRPRFDALCPATPAG